VDNFLLLAFNSQRSRQGEIMKNIVFVLAALAALVMAAPAIAQDKPMTKEGTDHPAMHQDIHEHEHMHGDMHEHEHMHGDMHEHEHMHEHHHHHHHHHHDADHM
jgi:pentapeptide MXKDX repeat protein